MNTNDLVATRMAHADELHKHVVRLETELAEMREAYVQALENAAIAYALSR